MIWLLLAAIVLAGSGAACLILAAREYRLRVADLDELLVDLGLDTSAGLDDTATTAMALLTPDDPALPTQRWYR